METHWWPLTTGLIQGAVGVVPIESMLSFCYGNVTSIQPTLVKYRRELSIDNLEGAALELKGIVKFYSGSFFNCFYALFDPLEATRIRRDYDINVFLWNILFNFGFLYSDVKNIYTYLTYKLPPSGKDARTWQTFGKYITDIIFRFLYSRHRSKAYFPLIPRKIVIEDLIPK